VKILFLTQYYPPETGAPQNRIHSLACYLKLKGVAVEVLTALPNYPKMEIFPEYKGKANMHEDIDGVKVYRAGIYVKKSKSVIARLLNYFSFVFSSMWMGLRLQRYDFIICESPPLFLGISAYMISRFKRSKLIFNVSDLWPESAEKLKIISNKALLGLAYRLESFLYKRSVIVTGQTQGIIASICSRFPKVKTYWLPNGVDFRMFTPAATDKAWRLSKGFSDNDFILLYAGVLGHAQGLEIILHAAEKLNAYTNIKFVIMGDGPEKDTLWKIKEEKKLTNLFFEPNTPRHLMPSVISSIDAAIIPLKKLDIFLGAIPSKIFEPLAYGKPILLGVDGEAKDLFIDKAKGGIFFEPENADALANAVIEIYNNKELAQTLGNNGLQFVKKNFDREKITHDFLNVLNAI